MPKLIETMPTSSAHIVLRCAQPRYRVLQAIQLSMACPTPGEIFNLVDNDSASRADAMRYAAGLLGVDLSAYSELQLDAGTQPAPVA